MKRAVAMSVIGSLLLVMASLVVPSAQAVDFSVIEAQVKQQAAQRQPGESVTTQPRSDQPQANRPQSGQLQNDQPPTVRVDQGSRAASATTTNVSKTAQHEQPEVTHWSVLNGIVRLRTVNGQLLLSFF